ncbi:hypothetical protein [Desulfobacter sp.]|uniref:hypothetical protein n=1 Tax=Desulfobacter sp. TaxID=2294 RepID=UPI00257CDCD8|nr:hypothetical protein [Desulfobacter sp.]
MFELSKLSLEYPEYRLNCPQNTTAAIYTRGAHNLCPEGHTKQKQLNSLGYPASQNPSGHGVYHGQNRAGHPVITLVLSGIITGSVFASLVGLIHYQRQEHDQFEP